MNTSVRPTDALSLSSSPPGIIPRNPSLPAAQQLDDVTWVDLPSADRLTLSAAQERYGLPPEAMTYFLLHYQSAKLIHAGPALFLVTFLAVPSLRHLFTTRELKICITPTEIVTLCGPSGRAQPELARTLPLLPGLSAGGAGRFLGGLLAGVVGSYEAIVKTVEDWRLDNATPREKKQQQRKRIEKLLYFLRDEQAFLSSVAREGRKLFAAEEGQQLSRLEERVGVLVRVAWGALGRGKAAKSSVESVPTAQKGGDA